MPPPPIIPEKATDQRNCLTAVALKPLRASHLSKSHWALCAHQSVEPPATLLHLLMASALRNALAARETAIEVPQPRVTQAQA